jgi:hypothetical protein
MYGIGLRTQPGSQTVGWGGGGEDVTRGCQGLGLFIVGTIWPLRLGPCGRYSLCRQVVATRTESVRQRRRHEETEEEHRQKSRAGREDRAVYELTVCAAVPYLHRSRDPEDSQAQEGEIKRFPSVLLPSTDVAQGTPAEPR